MIEKSSALIIGCSSGVGLQLASDLHYRSIKIIGIDKVSINNPEISPIVDFIHCDLSDSGSIGTALSNIDFSTVRKIYITAGMHDFSSALDVESAELESVFSVNAFAHLQVISFLLRNNIKNIHIIALGSLSAIIGLPFQQIYGSSKAAMQLIYESLSYELAKNLIQATVVRVGSIDTGFNNKNIYEPQEGFSTTRTFFFKCLNKINQPKSAIAPHEMSRYLISIKANSQYGTTIVDFGANSILLKIIRSLFGFRITSKLTCLYFSI